MANATRAPLVGNDDVMGLLTTLTQMRRQTTDATKRYVFIGEAMGGHICVAPDKKKLADEAWRFLNTFGGEKKKTKKVKTFLKDINTCVNVKWAYAVYVMVKEDGSTTINPITKEQYDMYWKVINDVVERTKED